MRSILPLFEPRSVTPGAEAGWGTLLPMFEPNAEHLLATLPADAVVLDVGGWASPFNRAQWILDAEPFDTRGDDRTFGGRPFQGGEREWFSKERWIQRDICGREPWPFADKQFDFVICSHTLEDIRDPLLSLFTHWRYNLPKVLRPPSACMVMVEGDFVLRGDDSRPGESGARARALFRGDLPAVSLEAARQRRVALGSLAPASRLERF